MTTPADTTATPRFANPLFVPLDVADLDEAMALAERLAPIVGGFKVGLELYTACGPAAVEKIRSLAPVFLDLKLHDIPNTVGRAAARCDDLGVALLTVHAIGGSEMVAAASENLRHGTVLGVTVLTSLSDDDLRATNQPAVSAQVVTLARLAIAAGAGGVVCAPAEAASARATVGPGPLVVTPGIRPRGALVDDHARAATPSAAIAAGADVLVVGRPITRAADPAAAAAALLSQLGR